LFSDQQPMGAQMGHNTFLCLLQQGQKHVIFYRKGALHNTILDMDLIITSM